MVGPARKKMRGMAHGVQVMPQVDAEISHQVNNGGLEAEHTILQVHHSYCMSMPLSRPAQALPCPAYPGFNGSEHDVHTACRCLQCH